MTHSKLPAGVPADNQTKTNAEGPASAPPEMAVPRFANNAPRASGDGPAQTAPAQFRRGLEFEDDVETSPVRAQRRIPGPAKNLSIMIAIVALIGALGAALFMMNGDKMPLCSTQPEWNQYNCRTG